MFTRTRLFLLTAILALLTVLPTAAQNATTCEAGFRLLENELLTTDPICIPENPQRIAAVDTFTLETLLALGIQPVSGPFLETFLRDHQQFTEQLEGVIDTDFPVNREALLQADPDVIISIEPWITDIYNDLAAIAPAVSLQYNGDGDWQNIARAVGAAVNQSEALETVFATYDERLTTFTEQAEAAQIGDVSIIFLLPDQLYPFLNETFSGAILASTGLNFPQALTEAAAGGDLTDVSKERIDLLNTSDHIFLVTSGFTDEDLAAYQELIATLEADPLWQSLPAFQADKVHIVGRDWIGSSLIAAHIVLDDLFRSILGVEPAEVSPDPYLPVAAEATPEATEASG